MDLSALLSLLAGLHPLVPVVLSVLGSLVVAGQAYVAITPSPNDDNWLANLESKPLLGDFLRAVRAFAPIQKK